MDIVRDFRAARLLAVLRNAGLRPTRQRVALARILFDRDTTRHVTAEQVFAETKAAGVSLSLATVYNTLHQFTQAGLLREVVLDSGRTHFDSNVAHHHHLVSSSGRVACVDDDHVRFSQLPEIPAGEVLDRIDVVIWTRKSA
jgi:Fur family transcriptional regulator, iron response regulator